MAWLVFLVISFRVNRNVVFFNFIAFVTTADGLMKKFGAKKHFSLENLFAKTISVFKYIIIMVIIIAAVKKCSGLLNIRYYIFEENSFKSALLGVAAKEYPTKAADFTLKNDLPENIFNLFNYGSYLAYRFYPQKKVFLDGRTELYGGDFFNAYEKALYVDKYTIEGLLKKYKVNTVFLAGDLWDRIDLTVYFFNEPSWVLVYLDEDATIFLKNTVENKAPIDKLKIDLKKWQILKPDLDKIGLKRVYPEPYIKFAWMFYYLGFDDLAIAQAKEALRILPSSADAYNILGRIYTKQKLYPKALEALRLANIYEPNYKETLISLGKFYLETDKTDKAIKVYKKMVKLAPYSSEGYSLLSQAYEQSGDLKSALKAMRTALKITPFSAEYYKELGRLLCKNKDVALAREIYQKAIAFGFDPEVFHKLMVNLQK
jgi:tetratricopeptide (TPR) repeat protein